MEGIDLFVKILSQGMKTRNVISLEVREASSSHLKKSGTVISLNSLITGQN